MSRLSSLGLSQPILSLVSPDVVESHSLGRVIFESHALCTVATESGDLSAAVHPKIHDKTDRVIVGDWVVLDRTGDPTWIVERLERQRTLVRRDPGRGLQVLCANIDLAIVATAMDRDLNPRRLERYLALIAQAGVPSALVLTKADLDPGRVPELLASAGSAFDRAFAVSALHGSGIEEVRAAIPHGHTAALLGSSGVGKTTLINALAGTTLETGAIREHDSRGRHTTTTRRLVPLPGGGWLVDNPGLRQVGPVGSEGVSATFADVEEIASRCRFRDCHHETEPGCAILGAVESGELSEARLAAWRKLGREVAYETRRTDREAERLERARWKKIQRANREREALRERDRG